MHALQALQNIDEAPQLPASYPAMAILALFPGAARSLTLDTPEAASNEATGPALSMRLAEGARCLHARISAPYAVLSRMLLHVLPLVRGMP